MIGLSTEAISGMVGSMGTRVLRILGREPLLLDGLSICLAQMTSQADAAWRPQSNRGDHGAYSESAFGIYKSWRLPIVLGSRTFP